MKVRATKDLYYGNALLPEGEVFTLVEIKGKKYENGKLVDHTYTTDSQFDENSMELCVSKETTKTEKVGEEMVVVERGSKKEYGSKKREESLDVL